MLHHLHGGGRIFYLRPSPARAAGPPRGDVAGEQLLSAPGDGAGVDADELGHLGVPAVADLHGLQPGVEPLLAFVQEAVESTMATLSSSGSTRKPGPRERRLASAS